MPVFTRPDAETMLARGPTHLAESIRRVTDFLARHTP
jgi:hypothetical protein